MRLEHAAIWTDSIERLKDFYIKYFNAEAGSKYHNPKKEFSSYFLTFSEGARLELMQMDGITAASSTHTAGYAHIAFSVDSKQNVVALTKRLQSDGCRVLSAPRITGDGYFESVVLDPGGNRVEITV